MLYYEVYAHVTAWFLLYISRMWANADVMAALPNVGGVLCSRLVHISATWQIRLNHPCAAAMCMVLCWNTLTTCYLQCNFLAAVSWRLFSVYSNLVFSDHEAYNGDYYSFLLRVFCSTVAIVAQTEIVTQQQPWRCLETRFDAPLPPPTKTTCGWLLSACGS